MDAVLKVLHVAKKDYPPAKNDDAYAFDAWDTPHVVAVSDGATTTFESKEWASLLTSSFVAEPQFGRTGQQVLAWSTRLAAKWRAALPLGSDAPWWALASAHEGAGATLLGARFEGTAADGGDWECIALGDACFFHVSGGKLVRAFPIEDPEEFDNVPGLICTDQKKTEASLGLLVADHGTWLPGDRFFLLTDALAKWFLEGRDDKPAPWETLEALDQKQFAALVPEWRASGLRDDDVTAIVIATSAVAPTVSAAPQAPEVPEVSHEPRAFLAPEVPEVSHGPRAPETTEGQGSPQREHGTAQARPRRRPNRRTSRHRGQPRLIPLITQVGLLILGILIVFALVGFLYIVMRYL